MKDAFIIDGIRTPIGKLGGSLSQIRADDLAALVMKELLNRNSKIDPAQIDDVIFGCANQAGEDNRNVARMALLLAGIPFTVPGETVNRLCASGMSAAVNAVRAIKSGDGDLYLAGGVENMTRAPFVMSKSESAFSGNVQIYDSTIGWRFPNPKMKEIFGIDSMGQTAENLAELYKILLCNKTLTVEEVRFYTEIICRNFKDLCYDLYLWAANVLENSKSGESAELAFEYYKKAAKSKREEAQPYLCILKLYNVDLDIPAKEDIIFLFEDAVNSVKRKSLLCKNIADFYELINEEKMKVKYLTLAAKFTREENL